MAVDHLGFIGGMNACANMRLFFVLFTGVLMMVRDDHRLIRETIGKHRPVERLARVTDIVRDEAGLADELIHFLGLCRSFHRIEKLPDAERQQAAVALCRVSGRVVELLPELNRNIGRILET